MPSDVSLAQGGGGAFTGIPLGGPVRIALRSELTGLPVPIPGSGIGSTSFGSGSIVSVGAAGVPRLGSLVTGGGDATTTAGTLADLRLATSTASGGGEEVTSILRLSASAALTVGGGVSTTIGLVPGSNLSINVGGGDDTTVHAPIFIDTSTASGGGDVTHVYRRVARAMSVNAGGGDATLGAPDSICAGGGDAVTIWASRIAQAQELDTAFALGTVSTRRIRMMI